MSETSRVSTTEPGRDPAPQPGARPSKAARVWQRTWVGLLLAAATGAVLFGAWHSETGAVVLVAGSLAMLGCVVEAARMAYPLGQRLLAPFLVAGLGLVAGLAREVADPGGVEIVPLGWRYLEAGALALLCARLGVRLRPRVPIAAVAGALMAAILALHLLLPVDLDPRHRALGAAALALAASLPDLRTWPASRQLILLAVLTLWLVPPLPAAVEVWRLFGPAGLTALVVLAKIGDIFGYYVGNALGRTHPFPRVSPGKTTAGCVGSLLGGVAAGGLLVLLGLLPSGSLGITGGLLAGLVVNLAAQAGDLFESGYKRIVAAKDSGSWFGPAGGVLDLCDSLLFAIPVALMTWPWILGEA